MWKRVAIQPEGSRLEKIMHEIWNIFKIYYNFAMSEWSELIIQEKWHYWLFNNFNHSWRVKGLIENQTKSDYFIQMTCNLTSALREEQIHNLVLFFPSI